MNITALRFANVVGPFSWHKKGVVTNYFKALMQGKPLTIYGDGSSTRDYLYVEDLCDGILKSIESNLVGFKVFHLATGKETSIQEIANYCLEICNIPENKTCKKRRGREKLCRLFSRKKSSGFFTKI